MSLPLLDPRNDLVFKLLFCHSLPLLTDLINAVRCNEPPVVVHEVKNPRIDPADLSGKYIVLDILATGADGEWFNIEMQMSRREKWSARSMYYLAKTLAGQLSSGKCSCVVNFKIVTIIAKNVVCVLNQAILRPRDELPPMVLNVFP